MAINLPHNISELLSIQDEDGILDFMFQPSSSNTLYNPKAGSVPGQTRPKKAANKDTSGDASDEKGAALSSRGAHASDQASASAVDQHGEYEDDEEWDPSRPPSEQELQRELSILQLTAEKRHRIKELERNAVRLSTYEFVIFTQVS